MVPVNGELHLLYNARLYLQPSAFKTKYLRA